MRSLVPVLAALAVVVFVPPGTAATTAGEVRWAGVATTDDLATTLLSVSASGADGLGNQYVAGTFVGNVTVGAGAGSVTLTGDAIERAFVAKYSAAGAILWARAIGYGAVAGAVTGDDLAVDALGNAYVTGTYAGDVRLGLTDAPLPGGASKGVWIERFDPSGDVSWGRVVTAVSQTAWPLVAVGADGTVAVAASFSGNATVAAFGGPTIIPYACCGYRQLVLRLASGTGLADPIADVFAPSSGGRFSALAIDSTGLIYANLSPFGSITINGVGYAGNLGGAVVSMRIDATHTISGVHAIYPRDPSGFPYGHVVGSGIEPDGAGGAYVLAALDAGGTIDGAALSWAFGEYHSILVHFAATGATDWVANDGSLPDDAATDVYPHALGLDDAGYPLVTGTFTGDVMIGGSAVSALGSAAYVARFAPTGTLSWLRTLSSSTAEMSGRGIAGAASHQIAVAGGFSGSTTIGTNVLTGAGATSVWVASYSATTQADPEEDVVTAPVNVARQLARLRWRTSRDEIRVGFDLVAGVARYRLRVSSFVQARTARVRLGRCALGATRVVCTVRGLARGRWTAAVSTVMTAGGVGPAATKVLLVAGPTPRPTGSVAAVTG